MVFDTSQTGANIGVNNCVTDTLYRSNGADEQAPRRSIREMVEQLKREKAEKEQADELALVRSQLIEPDPEPYIAPDPAPDIDIATAPTKRKTPTKKKGSGRADANRAVLDAFIAMFDEKIDGKDGNHTTIENIIFRFDGGISMEATALYCYLFELCLQQKMKAGPAWRRWQPILPRREPPSSNTSMNWWSGVWSIASITGIGCITPMSWSIGGR